MTEILNLNSLCRCCHVHGKFQDLRSKVDGVLDTYTDVLQQTFGVLIQEVDLSYTICEECIQQLKDSWRFKIQVINCENKFHEYYTNEHVFSIASVKSEIIDDYGDDVFNDSNLDYENEEVGNVKVEGIKSSIAKKAKRPRGRPKKIKRGRPKTSPLTQAEQHRAAVRRYVLKKRLEKVPLIISIGEVETKDENKTDSIVKTEEIELCVDINNEIKETDIVIKSDEPPAPLTEPPVTTNNKDNIKDREDKGNNKKDKEDNKKDEEHNINIKKEEEDNKDNKKREKTGHKNKTKDRKQTRKSIRHCNKCDISLPNLKELNKHKQEVHNDRKETHKCPICNAEFYKQRSVAVHMGMHDEERPFNCNRCDRSYVSKELLLQHRSAHDKSDGVICDICNKRFTCKSSLRKHILDHQGLRPRLLCHVCAQTCADQANLRAHVAAVHERARPYKCHLCHVAYSTHKNLKHHLRRHTGERPFKCGICDERFICNYSRNCHQRTHNEDGYLPPNVYKCKICGQISPTRGDAKKHMNSHLGSLPHKCHICTKDFLNKFSLNRHIETHRGIKRFPCELCERKFTAKAVLIRHTITVHDPTRPIQKVKCDLCKMSVRNMEKHMRSHEIRPHMCEICYKKFPERNSLNRHLKITHYGVKSHACDQCDKKYTKTETLRKHKINKHGFLYKRE